jgi:undecaprenyl-phosphate glucose phosphotransferase
MGDQGLIRPSSSRLPLLWRLVDASWIALAYWLACRMYPQGLPHFEVLAVSGAVLLFYMLGEPIGLYRPWRGAPLKAEILRVWTTWGAVVAGLLLVAFLSKTSSHYSRVVTVDWFLLTPMLLSVWRGGARYVLQELRARGKNLRSVAILGATSLGERLARMLSETPWLGLDLVGFFDDRDGARRHPIPGELGGVIGSLEAAVLLARAGKIDIVYVTLPMRAEPRIQQILRRFADTTCSVYIVPDLYMFDLLHARWSSVGEIPVVSIFESPFYGADGMLKRVEDIVLGAVIMGLIAIPMLLISLGIRLTSRGPIFFRQRRYGLNGQPIDILKFRTMTVCEDGLVVTQATRNDHRITPFGAFLRRTSLDELPQFLHVLTGKMSIVGPRPHAVAHNELYRSQIHCYMLRHKVKPGITGWAQVNGWRGETDTLEKMEKRIEHDLAYIRNWALSLDLKIIFMTIFGSAVRRNAY